jgi:hypothetical protein
MVAGADDRSRATPEPGVRVLRQRSGQAFPPRGPSEYRPLSSAPRTVNEVVAVSVKQAQAVEGVVGREVSWVNNSS